MSNPVQKFKFPTAEEITRDWGERCPDVDQDCGCCQMWNTFDLLAAKDAELAKLREALNRQADNMAFVINHVTLPGQWLEKFMVELDADRSALNQGASDA
ncbi:hypothetical protein ABCW43_00310 [Neorhizobium sp. IRAMC:178]|uniref:hypothetical protein n=1 Tax=Neorhizobium tunisiense TaxID=3144793 RepID=UPI0031F667BF